MSYNDKRELEELSKLEALEIEQHHITAQLTDSALYRERLGDVKQLQSRHDEIEQQLTQDLSRWEELASMQKSGSES